MAKKELRKVKMRKAKARSKTAAGMRPQMALSRKVRRSGTALDLTPVRPDSTA